MICAAFFFVNRSDNAYDLYTPFNSYISSLRNLPQKMYQCILRQCAQTLVCFGSKLCTCATFSPRRTKKQNDTSSSRKKHARLKWSSILRSTAAQKHELKQFLLRERSSYICRHCRPENTLICEDHEDFRKATQVRKLAQL